MILTINDIKIIGRKIQNFFYLKKYKISQNFLSDLSIINITSEKPEITKNFYFHVDNINTLYRVVKFTNENSNENSYLITHTYKEYVTNIFQAEILNYGFFYTFGLKIVKNKMVIIPVRHTTIDLFTKQQKTFNIDDYMFFMDINEHSVKLFIPYLCYTITIDNEVLTQLDLNTDNEELLIKNICALCYIYQDEIKQCFEDPLLEYYLDYYSIYYTVYLYDYKYKTKIKTMNDMLNIINKLLLKYPAYFSHKNKLFLAYEIGQFLGLSANPFTTIDIDLITYNPEIFKRLKNKNNKKLVKKLKQRFQKYLLSNFLWNIIKS